MIAGRVAITGGRSWIEFFDEFLEHGIEAVVVLVGVRANEVDDFSVAIGGLLIVASGLVDHAEAIPAIMNFGKAFEEVTGGALGLIELALTHEIDGGIGCGREFVVVVVVLEAGERTDVRRSRVAKTCAVLGRAFVVLSLLFGRPLTLVRLVHGQTTFLVLLATATRAGIIASGFVHRHQRVLEEDIALYRSLLCDARFYTLLLDFDRDLADAARSAGCTLCGGVVHSALYRRKPRGRGCAVGPEHDQRFSFCCAVDGCRSRATPRSLRFLGRKVYLATIVVLVSMMQHGVTERRMRQLTEAVGVDRRTVVRWQLWWREDFTASAFWQMARAAFMPPIEQDRLPAALIERFRGAGAEPLIALLRFIAPITGGKGHAR